MDLKKLEAHFKGKIPSADVSLLEALTEYNRKIMRLGQLKQESSEPLQHKTIASSLSNITFSSQFEPLTV